MKKRSLSKYLILALVLFLMIVPVGVSAQTTVKHCFGTESLIDVLNPGNWTFPDGNIHVRGMVSQYNEQMNCPEISGTNTVVMNANWDANYTGPMWGTNYLETPNGDWKGSWSGKLNPDGTLSYTGVSKGISGSVVGLKLKVYGYSQEPNGPTFIEITIRDPGGD
jgi:hypothetical protein